MLILGNHGSEIGPGKAVFNCRDYKTLDIDNGDYAIDLTGDTSFLNQKWDTVFNLGTIEHIWDAHRAYCNAIQMVKVGGYFINHAPVGVDFVDHGIHLTSPAALLSFFKINGFEIIDHFNSDNVIQWIVAKKLEHRTSFLAPQQVWTNGWKPETIS